MQVVIGRIILSLIRVHIITQAIDALPVRSTVLNRDVIAVKERVVIFMPTICYVTIAVFIVLLTLLL